jgi:hypothetical protein
MTLQFGKAPTILSQYFSPSGKRRLVLKYVQFEDCLNIRLYFYLTIKYLITGDIP